MHVFKLIPVLATLLIAVSAQPTGTTPPTETTEPIAVFVPPASTDDPTIPGGWAPATPPELAPRPYPRDHNASNCPVRPGNANFAISAGNPTPGSLFPFNGVPQAPVPTQPLIGTPVVHLPASSTTGPAPAIPTNQLQCHIIGQATQTGAAQTILHSSQLTLDPKIQYAFAWNTDQPVQQVVLLAYGLDPSMSPPPASTIFSQHFTSQQPNNGDDSHMGVVEFVLQTPVTLSFIIAGTEAIGQSGFTLYHEGN